MNDNLSKSAQHMVKTGKYKSPDKFKAKAKTSALKGKKDPFKGEDNKTFSKKETNTKGKDLNE